MLLTLIFFQPKLKDQAAGMWLGGHDLIVESTFLWDSSQKVFPFRNWDLQWKDRTVLNRGDYDCVNMWRDEGRWTDDFCTLVHPEQVTMCERVVTVISDDNTHATTSKNGNFFLELSFSFSKKQEVVTDT
jgi:hypothetical protein